MRQLALALCFSLSLAACGGGQQTRGQLQPERAAQINLELGIDYFRKGRLEQAKEKIEKALEQDSRNASAHAAAGLLYDRLNDERKADSHFQRALSLDSKNPEVRNNYAAFLCQRGQHDRGEKMALTALNDALYKTPEIALLNAGNCSRNAGRLDAAEAHYRKALERRPRFAPVLFQMADLELHQKNFMAARAFLERHMEIARASAASLYLGYRIERELGNLQAADGYARRLRNEFPTSSETKELIQSERRAG